MKTRVGFVSNSSSSSFVVLLNEMTSHQRQEFEKWADNIDWEEICYEYSSPCFSMSGKVFGGECDYAASDMIIKRLKETDLYHLYEDLT